MTDALRKPIAGLQVSIDCHSLDHVQLVRFLERRRANPMFPLELSLADNLSEVLRRANGFVPSASGCILLDDPQAKQEDRRKNLLTFIAAFGDKSEGLVGRTIPGDQGIAGRVYMTGETYVTSDAPTDRFFYKRMDEETRYQTNSLIAVPIRIEQEVCGVLELINRKDASAFSQQDRNLLEVFAGYISISIQNVLDGRQAQEIAKRDNLTGLYNDRYLHIALADSIRYCTAENKDLAAVFMDLDYFKRVNDTHGHPRGDSVLQEFAARVQAEIREVDTLARYGGEEFAVVLPETAAAGAQNLAERICAAIRARPFTGDDGEVPLAVTVSIGASVYPDHGGTARDLIHAADRALYFAKETGRDRWAMAVDAEQALDR